MAISGATLVHRLGVGVAVLVTWVFVLATTVPRANSSDVWDYGFFLTMADRLLAGDALYADVWDNKDPLIYYSLALVRPAGPVGGWLLELVWVALSALAVFIIARTSRVSPAWSTLVGFALAPVAILGLPYFMGTTYLPGIALTLVALALVATDHPRIAGVAFAALIFFKFLMWPLALAGVIVYLLASGRRRSLLPFAAAAAVTVAGFVLLLAVRGELPGFLETQVDNVLYSQSPIVSAELTGPLQKVTQHLVVLVNRNVLMIEFASVAILVVAALMRRRANPTASWRAQTPLWWTAFTTFVVAGLIVAVTGKWFYHAEVFAVSSALVLVVLVDALRGARPVNSAVVLVVAVLSTYLLAGAPPLASYPKAIGDLPGHVTEAFRTDPLTVALEDRTPATVAFLGSGYSLPRSGGLGDWEIACRFIAQRPFNPQKVFDETVDCLPTAEVVVVTEGYSSGSGFPDYDAFVARAEDVLARDFTCEQDGPFRICSRVS